YTNNYELGYSTLLKKANLNFSVFARNTTGSIQSVRTPIEGGVQRVTYANIGQEDAYGGSVFASINSSKVNLNGGIDTYYAVLNNNVPDPLYNASNEGFVVSGRVFGSYKITELWALQAFSFYRGRQVQLQGDQSGFGIYSLSVRRDFTNKKGSIGFGAENFFTNSITIRNQVNTPLLDQSSTSVLRNLSLKVNISYRIGKLTAAAPTRRGKSINNDDLKGDGGGGNDLGGGAPAGGGGAPGGGARPGGAPGGARPGSAPAGARPSAGAPAGGASAPALGGAPAVPRGASPDSTAAPTPADSTARPANGQQPSLPSNQMPMAQPADSTSRPAAPTNAPTNPLNSPANRPSPGTTTPGGITPAGSPGGRP
ncbi:MAG TPA: outer membrane beta-barrel protein, partial [Hymenobacter sp.]